MKSTGIKFFIAGLLLVMLHACTRDVTPAPNPTPTATPYTLATPAHFPDPVIPTNNPLTVEGIKMGRMFYYDTILSTNNMRCATCHVQANAFSIPLYTRPNGEKISVMPHINLAWNVKYNWDGSAPVLDLLPLGDFEPEFFNTDMDLLVVKLKNHKEYPALFKTVFGVSDISTLSHNELKLKIVYSLSQFLRTMVSNNSKYDRYLRREVNLTPSELNGYTIFNTEKGDCFHCHGTALFTNNVFTNNGLDTLFIGQNKGYYLVTGDPKDMGKFRATTLRNIELTAPYMHDGRFATLQEVIEFYNSGVHQNSPNIDPIMTKDFKKYGLQLTPQDKADLLAFLKTLTDTTFTHNPAFASPF